LVGRSDDSRSVLSVGRFCAMEIKNYQYLGITKRIYIFD
jgi:hypothetical protein